MGSLGDSGAENGGLNSPTYMAPLKLECPPLGGGKWHLPEWREEEEQQQASVHCANLSLNHGIPSNGVC